MSAAVIPMQSAARGGGRPERWWVHPWRINCGCLCGALKERKWNGMRTRHRYAVGWRRAKKMRGEMVMVGEGGGDASSKTSAWAKGTRPQPPTAAARNVLIYTTVSIWDGGVHFSSITREENREKWREKKNESGLCSNGQMRNMLLTISRKNIDWQTLFKCSNRIVWFWTRCTLPQYTYCVAHWLEHR